LLKRRLGDRIAEAHRDQRRKHIGHCRPMRRDRAVVPVGMTDPAIERGAHDHLPGAEQERQAENAERKPEMRENEPPAIQHRSISVCWRSFSKTRLYRLLSPSPTWLDGRRRRTRGMA